MSQTTKSVWKLLGATVAVVAGAMFVSMLPDLRRYLKNPIHVIAAVRKLRTGAARDRDIRADHHRSSICAWLFQGRS